MEDYKQAVSEMTELIMHEWSNCQLGSSPEMKLMCARGLLMLLHMEELGEFDWFHNSFEIMSAVLAVFDEAQAQSYR